MTLNYFELFRMALWRSKYHTQTSCHSGNAQAMCRGICPSFRVNAWTSRQWCMAEIPNKYCTLNNGEPEI